MREGCGTQSISLKQVGLRTEEIKTEGDGEQKYLIITVKVFNLMIENKFRRMHSKKCSRYQLYNLKDTARFSLVG